MVSFNKHFVDNLQLSHRKVEPNRGSSFDVLDLAFTQKGKLDGFSLHFESAELAEKCKEKLGQIAETVPTNETVGSAEATIHGVNDVQFLARKPDRKRLRIVTDSVTVQVAIFE